MLALNFIEHSILHISPTICFIFTLCIGSSFKEFVAVYSMQQYLIRMSWLSSFNLESGNI